MPTLDRDITVHFGHWPLLMKTGGGARYARALADELQPLVQATEVQTREREPDEVGGPGIDFDTVMLTATAAASTYAAWRIVAADISRVIARLLQLGDGRAFIDEGAAIRLAVDYAATPDSFAEVSIVFVAPIRGPDEYEYEDTPRGYLVGLIVEGVSHHVVITAKGDPLGTLRGLDNDGLQSLGFGRTGDEAAPDAPA